MVLKIWRSALTLSHIIIRNNSYLSTSSVCLPFSQNQITLNNFYSKLQNQGASINVRSCGEPWIAFSSLHSPLDLCRHPFCNHPFPLTAAHHPSQAALLLMNFLSCSLKNVNTQSHSNWILNLSKFLSPSLSFYQPLPLEHSFVCSLGTLSHSLLFIGFVMYPTSVRRKRGPWVKRNHVKVVEHPELVSTRGPFWTYHIARTTPRAIGPYRKVWERARKSWAFIDSHTTCYKNETWSKWSHHLEMWGIKLCRNIFILNNGIKLCSKVLFLSFNVIVN